MQSTENEDKATAEEKLEHWLNFAEANRPGHDSLRGVSYEPAPIRQAWLADVLTALAVERGRADRAETALVEAWDRGADYGVASTHPTLRDNPYRSKATA